MISLEATAEFIRRHYPGCQDWGRDLEKWITWASHKGFLFQVCSDKGLLGVAIARPIPGLKGLIDNNDWHNENGKYIFIDLAVAPTRSILQAVAFAILSRFGNREFAAFRRHGKIKVHNLIRARKALLKLR